MAAVSNSTDHGCTRRKKTPLFMPFQSLESNRWISGKWDGGRNVSKGIFGFMMRVSLSNQLHTEVSQLFHLEPAWFGAIYKSHWSRRSIGFSSSCMRVDSRATYLFHTPSRTGLRSTNIAYPSRRLCSSWVCNACS